MLYVLDVFHKPALVVDITPKAEEAAATAQRYANQTGRAVVVAEGEDPAHAKYRAIVPQEKLPIDQPDVIIPKGKAPISPPSR